MSLLNKHLTQSLQWFEQIRLSLRTLWERSKYMPGRSGLLPSSAISVPSNSSSENAWENITGQPLPPSLDAVLEQSGPLPPYSTILGICGDGLPFLLDLTNPAPGAILITGDKQSGKAALLQNSLASAARLNPVDKLNLNIISAQPDKFSTCIQSKYCQVMLHSDNQSTGTLIKDLKSLAEDRRRNKPQNPVIILAIDNLAACLNTLDDQDFARLYWLIKHGPRSYIWTIATLHAEHIEDINPRLVCAFRTHIYGSVAESELASYLTGSEDPTLADLEKGTQFCTPYGDNWLHFWLCVSSDEISVKRPQEDIQDEYWNALV